MIASIPWLHSALISSGVEFWFVEVFPLIWTLPHFQRSYYQSSYFDFVLHADLETRLFT
jgi:hypothetical protein